MVAMVRSLPRVYVNQPLAPDARVTFTRNQAHYLRDVMRLGTDAAVAVFNGHDGEWRVGQLNLQRKAGSGVTLEQIRTQSSASGPDLFFAPVKKTATDFIVAKATELGARALRPVMTEFTDTGRVNVERLQINAREAAEQCGRLEIPQIGSPIGLRELVGSWPLAQSLIIADETGNSDSALKILNEIRVEDRAPAFVVGPQGGFSKTELAFLRALPFVITIDLGPRILRAETAVVAALTCWQATRGDWA